MWEITKIHNESLEMLTSGLFFFECLMNFRNIIAIYFLIFFQYFKYFRSLKNSVNAYLYNFYCDFKCDYL